MLNRTVAAAWAVISLLPALAGAQGRVIALPDTMGANFSVADSARALGTPHDYDPLLGFWHFHFQYRNEDGSFGEFSGHWSFEMKQGGGLMIDAWRPDDPNEPMDVSLYTIRLFNPELKVWEVVGARVAAGKLAPGKSWASGGSLYLVQRNRGGLMRVRYFAIEKDRFFWRADHSKDNGKTWLRDFGVMEATRIGR